jgi:hypothetical protein
MIALHARSAAFLACAAAAALLALAPPVCAGPIPLNTWLEFAVSDPGVGATGCDPDDPNGPFCIPSGGTPTQFLDAPPWTFSAPASGASLRVTDAFESTEQFEVFDFGVSVGLTSPPAATAIVDCGDDPVVCFGTAGMSRGTFALASGSHSITIVPTLSLGGAGYFQVVAAAVPEPGGLALLALGLAGIAALRFRPRSR